MANLRKGLVNLQKLKGEAHKEIICIMRSIMQKHREIRQKVRDTASLT